MDCSLGFDMFLRHTISRMSASRLQSSLARSARGALYERQYQMEFYSAAVSYLPSSVSIAPDVGTVSPLMRRSVHHGICTGLGILKGRRSDYVE